MFPANPVVTFLLVYTSGALAGLTAALRSSHQLTARYVIAAVLNGGFVSLGIFLAAYAYVPQYPYLILAICVFASLGGMTVTKVILYAFRQGGLTIIVRTPHRDVMEDTNNDAS